MILSMIANWRLRKNIRRMKQDIIDNMVCQIIYENSKKPSEKTVADFLKPFNVRDLK